tara:strand:+ start:281 stop:475 length:195 start_codon:yes stop_codon:yes gene_type:complete
MLADLGNKLISFAFGATATPLPNIPIYNPSILIVQFPVALQLTRDHVFAQSQWPMLEIRGESAV